MSRVIALLTDFGTDDHYVGVMKGVMHRICPEAVMIDITHEVKRQSVRSGAIVLANSYQFFAKGSVFLIVVDPGVGSSRKPVAARAGDYWFIAPDNGVLSYVLEEIGDYEMVELANAQYQLPNSSTFHGRDIFAPAAGYLARGDVELSAFGEPVTSPVWLPQPVLRRENQRIIGEVVHVDHFGNVLTSIGPTEWVDSDNLRILLPGDNVDLSAADASIEIADQRLEGIVRAYHEVGHGEILVHPDSSGYLEIAVNHGSAADMLGVEEGVQVTLYMQ